MIKFNTYSTEVSIKVLKSLCLNQHEPKRVRDHRLCLMLTNTLSQHTRFCQLQNAEWSTNLQHQAEMCGWQYVGRNSCGWAPWRVAACVDLSVFLQSHPSTEGLQSSQWVGVKSKEVRKTTAGSASAQGLSTATASCVCLPFPKQNTEPPNSSLHFPPTASHIFPHWKTKWLCRCGDSFFFFLKYILLLASWHYLFGWQKVH